MTDVDSEPSFRLDQHLRIRHTRDFDAAYRTRIRRAVGPLLVYGRPNGRPQTRLGMSVPRRAGNAVVRNLIKRRLRESFRLLQHDLPAGYDVVVNVKPHEPLSLAAYQDLLSRACHELHRHWTRRPNTPAE